MSVDLRTLVMGLGRIYVADGNVEGLQQLMADLEWLALDVDALRLKSIQQAEERNGTTTAAP